MGLAMQETLCTKCIHLQVCKHVEEMEGARVRVNDLKATISEPVEIIVTCNKHRQNSGNIR